MYKLQALKSKVSHVAIGTVLAVSLATLGLVPAAFAAPGDPAESDVFLYRADDIDPPDDKDIEEGKDYNVTVPSDGLYGLISEVSADNYKLDYAVLEEGVKDYSLELQNNTTFDIYVQNVKIADPHTSLKFVSSAAFEDVDTGTNIFCTSFAPTGGAPIDVNTTINKPGGETPASVDAWTIERTKFDEGETLPGTLGIIFEGKIKNIDINMFPPLDDSPAGLKAYTIVWTLAFNGNIK